MCPYNLNIFVLITSVYSAATRSVRSDIVFPKVLEERQLEGHLTVWINDEVTINLRETTAFASTLHIISYEEGTRQQTKINMSDIGGKVYTDPVTASVLLVTQSERLLVEGFLGKGMRISPIKNATPNDEGSVAHILTEIDEQSTAKQGYNTTEYGDDSLFLRDVQERSSTQEDDASTNPSEPLKVTVKAVAVISKEYSDSFNAEGTHKVQRLLEYLQLFFSAVNQVFGRTEKNRLDLKVVVVALVLLSESTEIYTKRYPTNNELLMAPTPEAFNLFIKLNKHIFDDAHVGLYLSKRPFARKGQEGSDPVTLNGMAYTGAACTAKCGALVRDDQVSLEGWNIAAHEMLHLLGAAHDGDPAPTYLTGSPGAKDCPQKEEHIMKIRPKGGVLSLSTCTLNQVLHFARSERGECLRDSEPRKMTLLSEEIIREPLEDGEKYCKSLYKNATAVKLVANFSNEFNLQKCFLVCATTNSINETSYSLLSAPDNTHCGTVDEIPQACLKGECRQVPPTRKPFYKWLEEQYELSSALNDKSHIDYHLRANYL